MLHIVNRAHVEDSALAAGHHRWLGGLGGSAAGDMLQRSLNADGLGAIHFAMASRLNAQTCLALSSCIRLCRCELPGAHLEHQTGV